MKKTIATAAFSLALVAPWIISAGPASAETSKLAFTWHVADQFLEEAVDSPPWAIAEAPNGDEILLDGAGSLDAGAKTASGEGRFRHIAADGSLVGEGTFTANRLVSFQFYGCGGPEVPDNLCGGLAKLDVTLSPEGTSLELPGTLWIDCLIGDNIPAGGDPARAEGIRLNVKGLINFNQTHAHSGFTVFLK